MNQSEALDLAIEMLERVAPGTNYDTREYYDNLRDIKATTSSDGPAPKISPLAPHEGETMPKSTPASWLRTAIVCGEEFCEIARQTIEGRDLILMESCRDRGEAPGIIVDASTNEIVLDEAYNGFQDYLAEVACGDERRA